MKAATASIIRELDRLAIEEYGIPGAVLMENAGRGAAGVLMERFPEAAETGVTIVAGTGNNGGDGFVIARHLANRGVAADVFIAGNLESVRQGESAANLATIRKMGIPVVPIAGDEDLAALGDSIATRGVVVDALLGTGLEREVTGIFSRVIALINDGYAILSVDIPSGISSDTGTVLGSAVTAGVTVTFGLPKVGTLVHPGAEHCGELIVLDIGIPEKLAARMAIRDHVLTPELFEPLLTGRRPTAHKGDFGHALILAGSMGKVGAASLCGMGALVAGAGLVTVGIPESQVGVLAAKLTEAMTEPLPDTGGVLDQTAFGRVTKILEGKTAVALGPGLGTGGGAWEVTRRLVTEIDLPLVIDADGINVIAQQPDILKKKKGDIILTPHPGEMGRLIGKTAADVQADRIGVSRAFAEGYGVWLVLKGARTIIASPSGDVFIATGGNPGMASGGMGDLLTGLIGGFLATSGDPGIAAAGGVFIHAAAADRAAGRVGEISLVAGDVLAEVPGVITELCRGGRDFPGMVSYCY
jgi:ADP-dependent NAD(P)H-hydrate dehydratase / NAD(P)H-hydrate epimerase